MLVVASDGDMQAQAYAGDILGLPAPDMVSVIRLGGGEALVAAGTVELPTSVIGPPASLWVSPDGHCTVVVETRGPRPVDRSDARLKDLPPGQAITVVDLLDPDRPHVVQYLTARNNPISVSTRADNALVAVAYDTSEAGGAPLDLYGFANGQLVVHPPRLTLPFNRA